MTPRTPPAWIIQDLKKRGESLARYKAKIQKQKKSVLDWDIRLLAHLGLLSDFTPGQGDMVLRLLTEATELRLKQSKANVKAHELTYLDVRKVIDGAIHKANETPVEFGRRHLEMFRRESQGEDNESQEEDSESQEEDSESPEDDDEYLP
jgi:hypothetical protein